MSSTRIRRRSQFRKPSRIDIATVAALFFAAAVGTAVPSCGGAHEETSECSNGSFDDDVDPSTPCVKWSTCPAGEYVVSEGSEVADRICGACDAGSFTVALNTPTCSPWSLCDPGFEQTSAGSSTQDRDCASFTWTHQFGSTGTDWAEAAAIDSDGHVIVAGFTSGLSGQLGGLDTNAFVKKFDATGAEVWTRQFGSYAEDAATDLAVDSLGNIFVIGNTSGPLAGTSTPGDQDAFVRKYDRDGTVVWTHQIGTTMHEHGSAIAVTGDGGVVVVGSTAGYLAGEANDSTSDAFVRRYDSDGVEMWTQQFGATGPLSTGAPCGGNAVSIDSAGTIVVTGGTSGALAGLPEINSWDVFIRAYDADGIEMWTRVFGSTGSDYAVSSSIDSAGSIYVAGSTNGSLDGFTSAGSSDVFVSKFDSTGTPLWSRQFGTEFADEGHSVSIDAQGGVLIAGHTYGSLPGSVSFGDQDAFLRKYDALGAEVWTRQFGSVGTDSAREVRAAHGEMLIVAGFTTATLPLQSSGGGYDGFVMRVIP